MINYRQANLLKFQAVASGLKERRAYGSGSLFFSIRYHNIARYLFITLTFAGLLATGWFGIPLIPKYLVDNQVDLLAGTFTLLSALGTIWGVTAYREFTRSIEVVIDARMAARRVDPMIGDYEYRSYDPITKKYQEGFVPSGPVDFWDKETNVPDWMDKGKYWHFLLSLQGGSRDIRLKVVKDSDLPFYSGDRNVAVTARGKAISEERTSQRYRYVVKIPQWLVMNTERKRFVDTREEIKARDLSALIADVNRKIVLASDEVASWEKQRVRYPWKRMTIGLYLNKSLPLRLVYRQVIRHFPGAKRRGIHETNANLANVKDEELVSSLLELASEKGIPQNRMDMLKLLLRFLENAYSRLGLGEGASEYHSFHHSLEVSYMALHMLPMEFQQFTFEPKDYEVMLVAGLIHDYDPGQAKGSSAADSTPKGPSVKRTIAEIQRSKIIDAYFTMTRDEFENYFREFKSALTPPVELATTHPEYVKAEFSPVESTMVEALIWRTDFPFFKQNYARETFARLLMELTTRGLDADKVKTLAEVLWLADLAVTYMGSDPVRAWDRVTNLYDELNLPKLEAVPRTDAFFSDFAENEIFARILSMRHFPNVFRQRWNLIYKFFHEGNPSTQLNRTIATARKMYLRVNLEIGMRRGDMLQTIATENWGEYFIGIGKDQNEVFKAKSRFATLDPQNASAFWGDAQLLLPALTDRSIDNFLLVVPEHSAPFATVQGEASFLSMLKVLTRKLTRVGSLIVLTDMENDGPALAELVKLANQAGFKTDTTGKLYFPKGWRDPEFKADSRPQVVRLSLK